MPGNDHEFFARDTQVGEDHLHGGEDGVISAARTPANFLIGLKIFFV